MVVSDGGPDARSATGAHRAGEVDVPRVIAGFHIHIIIRFDGGVSDVSLRIIIKEVHGDGGVKGHGLRFAAGGGDRQISRHRFSGSVHRFRGGHRRAAVDVRLRVIGLVHAKHSAAQAIGIGGARLEPRISIQDFRPVRLPEGAEQEIHRRIIKERLDTARKVHGGGISLGIHIHIAAGYHRGRYLRIVRLPDVRLGAVVVINQGHRHGAAGFVCFAGRLRPAVHQFRETYIRFGERGKYIADNFRDAAPLPGSLPRHLRLRVHGHVAGGLHVRSITYVSGGVILLRQIGEGYRGGIVLQRLVAALACGLGFQGSGG